VNELGERLLKLAITLVAVAFLLQWAWSMARPLVPFAIVGLVVWGVIRVVQARRQRW
jgi:hypothetical protein